MNNSLTIYLTYFRNNVKYFIDETAFSKQSNAKMLMITDFETIMSKRDFAKFLRGRNHFDTSGNGGGNFILNNLEQDYTASLQKLQNS